MLNSFSPLLAFFLCLFLFQHVPECGKRIMGHCVSGFIKAVNVFIRYVVGISSMLVIMTINAEILPIAPVGRIVVVIVIFMMDRKHVQVFLGELPAAAGTYPWMDSQRLFAVALQTLFSDLPGLLRELGQLLAARCGAGLFRRF